MLAELGLPDLLADGPRTVTQLAAEIQNDEGMQLDPSKLRRLMRFLVGRGIFERGPDTPDGLPQFQNNELTHHMRKCATPPPPPPPSPLIPSVLTSARFRQWSCMNDLLCEHELRACKECAGRCLWRAGAPQFCWGTFSDASQA